MPQTAPKPGTTCGNNTLRPPLECGNSLPLLITRPSVHAVSATGLSIFTTRKRPGCPPDHSDGRAPRGTPRTQRWAWAAWHTQNAAMGMVTDARPPKPFLPQGVPSLQVAPTPQPETSMLSPEFQ
jgi:hypothetical protein